MKRLARLTSILGLLAILITVLVSSVALSVEKPPADPAKQESKAEGSDSLNNSSSGTGVVEADASEAEPTVGDFLVSTKNLAMYAFIVVGLLLLFIKRINLWVRIAAMVGVFVVFGLDILIPLHPSPICAVTQLFMFRMTTGTFFPIFIALFLAIFVPCLIGRKLFCGWVCPLGAVQELVNKIPFKPRWKQFNFGKFNAVRFALLIMFILTFFFVKDQIAGLADELGEDAAEGMWAAYSAYSFYTPINFFELLHWNIDATWWIMMAILVLASLMLYRPFCYSICPIGAISWLMEKIAPARVRIDHSLCNQCNVCILKSPCPTIKPLVEGKPEMQIPDCTSCGECLDTCSRKAIKFGFKL